MKANEVAVSHSCSERIRRGSLWIYRGDVKGEISAFSAGEIIRVLDERGKFVGKGYINPSQTLLARLLTTRDQAITPDFFRQKIVEAARLRESLGFSPRSPRRIIHSEGDGLPGLIVDQYGEILVAQFLTAGMEKWKSLLLDLLQEIFSPSVILEKSKGEFRKEEGLEEICKIHLGELPDSWRFEMDGLKFCVDFLEGHKTGFYLDQAENRRALKDYTRGRVVMDAFAHTGAMSLYTAAYGATKVEAVEDSGKIFPLLERNIAENRMEKIIAPVCANAFRRLREKISAGQTFGCMILDPPSFARNKREIKDALRGYKELHLSAFKLLEPGGFLATYSCSQNIKEEAFLEAIVEAAADTVSFLQLIEKQGASRDHPVRAGMGETDYLKGFVFRKT